MCLIIHIQHKTLSNLYDMDQCCDNVNGRSLSRSNTLHRLGTSLNRRFGVLKIKQESSHLYDRVHAKKLVHR
ncbi:hypothetical protein Lal_00006215 [Lupinus albus]|nr:hypothetical protein Lal_00006215 [Lupinus albus]